MRVKRPVGARGCASTAASASPGLAISRRLDTVLEVLDSDGNLIARNDNAHSNTKNSQLTVDVVAGQTYTIRISAVGSKRGDYAIDIDYLLAGGL